MPVLRRRQHPPAASILCRGYPEAAANVFVSTSISISSKFRGIHIFLCTHHSIPQPSRHNTRPHASTQTPPAFSGRIQSMSRLSRGCCHHVHLHSEIFKKARCTHFFYVHTIPSSNPAGITPALPCRRLRQHHPAASAAQFLQLLLSIFLLCI